MLHAYPHILVNKDTIVFDNLSYRCAIGRSDFSLNKKEGDGCTPVGVFPLRECWYRADRLKAPKTGLPLREIHEDDGWCDDPESKDYNQRVKSPYNFSYEKLWREDHVYDLIVPIGYNDDPVVLGKGSAIFLHAAAPDYAPTEGCITLALPDLLALLRHLDTDSVIEIKPS